MLKKEFITILNNDKRNFEGYVIDNDILLFPIENEEAMSFQRTIQPTDIEFFFCLQGGVQFEFNEGSYTIPLLENRSFTIYNPNKSLPHTLRLQENTKLVLLRVPIQEFHKLFMAHETEIQFLKEENIDKKYYAENEIKPMVQMVLNQIFSYSLDDTTRMLFYKAKVYEIFTYFFGKTDKENAESCPYLRDEENVMKIKTAKDILLENMSNPPTIKQLSEQVDLPEHKLKDGFKNLYGFTVYNYLMEYKMKTAIELLEQSQLQIQEIAFKVGYENPSHFIVAFKKKFGVTPKQYHQSK